MKINIWLDRITSESNLWLNAVKMEDSGNFFEAIGLYLNDASLSLKQGYLLKAALSCSAAGNCLTKMGDFVFARKLFEEAAMIYEEYSEHVLGKSIRESLWSIEEAYEHFLLSGNEGKSKQTYQKYLSLATKVDPFSGETEAMKKLDSRKIAKTVTTSNHKNNLTLSSEINKAIEEFLRLRSREFKDDNNQPSDSQIIQQSAQKENNSRASRSPI